ncbi:hypothetical protein AwPolaro_02740 [Polaromonas sp.]|nr:hypothetical protein AwPolaro_02740 [Polaromonas sp.]
MPKMIVSHDGIVIQEVQLTQDRTAVGRRPYNDIVIDNLAVSGEHAVVKLSGSDVYIEDLGSTNGTYVNGKAVKKELLKNGDLVEIGKYQLEFSDEASSNPAVTPVPSNSAIQVLTGAAAGREVALLKVVTTLGKPGVAVAAITHRAGHFVLTHVEGSKPTLLNSVPVVAEGVALQNGDRIDLAGTEMQFVQR